MLPPSLYHISHSHLRPDGRRWNELRRLTAQISIQAAADGSSYLEIGLTKVLCTVSGPSEIKGGRREEGKEGASVDVRVGMMGGKRAGAGGGRGDRRLTHLSSTISSAFTSTLFTHLYPHSTITLQIHILSLDGSLLAACLNAATLALIDAGIPMKDYLVACTAGLTPPGPGGGGTRGGDGDDDSVDPLLDLNGVEEVEVPFLTVGTVGAGERVSVCVMESRVRVERVEGMLAVGVDGCKQVREVLDGVVRERGRRVLGFGKRGG